MKPETNVISTLIRSCLLEKIFLICRCCHWPLSLLRCKNIFIILAWDMSFLIRNLKMNCLYFTSEISVAFISGIPRFFQADKVRRSIFRFFFNFIARANFIVSYWTLFQNLRKPKLIRDVSFDWSALYMAVRTQLRI